MDTRVRRHSVHIPVLEREIDCAEDESVFAAARRAGVRIVGACGGRGSCGSCIVRVDDGRVHREGEGAHKKWLRACRVQPRSDNRLFIRGCVWADQAKFANQEGHAEPLQQQ